RWRRVGGFRCRGRCGLRLCPARGPERATDAGVRLRRYIFLLEISGNFGAVVRGELAWIGMNRFRPVVDNKEKENADEQIKSQRMHVTHTAPSQELVSQMPGTRNQPSDRGKKLRVPI